MSDFIRQHLIDPEICIRCYTCEEMCPIGAITHDDLNVVVDAAKCNHCMTCIAPCPTGSIDNWRVVPAPYSIAEQLSWKELPGEQDLGHGAGAPDADAAPEALDDAVAALIAEAHKGAKGRTRAPASASKPVINLHTPGDPLEAVVQGNYRLTAEAVDADVRHVVLDLGRAVFPVLEGQSIGIVPPGTDAGGKPHLPRLYSVSSPRDGERPNKNNLSLTVKRVPNGVCSNYVCDLKKGDKVRITGPFGTTFLLPGDPQAKLLMVCTGTGSAPFRAFTMRRQRVMPEVNGSMLLFFGARSPGSLPYFGPLTKVPEAFLARHFAFSRVAGEPRNYVQDTLRSAGATVASLLGDRNTHVYVCGLRQMEAGVEQAFLDIAKEAGIDWESTRAAMREAGRYHVETY
jgi:benzoyl-CoA 2,3-dioxygenase component A